MTITYNDNFTSTVPTFTAAFGEVVAEAVRRSGNEHACDNICSIASLDRLYIYLDRYSVLLAPNQAPFATISP